MPAQLTIASLQQDAFILKLTATTTTHVRLTIVTHNKDAFTPRQTATIMTPALRMTATFKTAVQIFRLNAQTLTFAQ